jgi:uncharacterized membrane protein (UPF0127 family)
MIHSHSALRSLCAWALVAAALPAAAQTQPQKLSAIRLNAGIHNISAEVASSPDERATGLMFREKLGTNDGMLFVFDRPATQCFWMKNTFLPLSIAFIADDGTIVNIDEMPPQSLESHCSAEPVRFVLEMNKGWFAKRGIKRGFTLQGPPFRR